MFDTSTIVENHKQYMQGLRADVKLARKERSERERELEKSFKDLRASISEELSTKEHYALKWLKAPMLAALVTCTLLVI